MINILILLNSLLSVILGASAVESHVDTENPRTNPLFSTKKIILTGTILFMDSDIFNSLSNEIQLRQKNFIDSLEKTVSILATKDTKDLEKLHESVIFGSNEAIRSIVVAFDDYVLKNKDKQESEKISCLQDLQKVFLAMISDCRATGDATFFEQLKENLIFDSMFDNTENLAFVTYSVLKLHSLNDNINKTLGNLGIKL
ncbi:hypothetical protein GVAV_002013 [Gurleya vavrai]